MSNKALLKRAELELTQRIQMLFPCGAVADEFLAYWNSCPKGEWENEINTALVALFSKELKVDTLRRLYTDEVISLAQGRMAVYEIVKSVDFMTMFGSLNVSLDLLCTTVLQREAFCEVYRYKLRHRGFPNYFLHRSDESKTATPDNLFVGIVGVDSDGMNVVNAPFDNKYIQTSVYRPRVIVQLPPLLLSSD